MPQAFDPNTNAYREVNNVFPVSTFTGQIKIVTTGVAVQFPSNQIVNGISGSTLTTNTNPSTIGGSSVTSTFDGTGNGQIIQQGAGFAYGWPQITNSNQLWGNGTAGDIITFQGS